MVRIQSLSLLIIGLLSFSNLQGQGQDCISAVVLCSDGNISFNPSGIGAVDDFANNNNDPGCLGSDEKNSAWYYIEFSANLPPGFELTFNLLPLGGDDEDYDFAIYGPNVPCDNLGEPVRCSYASANCTFCPSTGLSDSPGVNDTSEGVTGDGFVRPLEIEPGGGYWLMVDNWAGTSTGFELSWAGPAAPFLNCTVDPSCTMQVTINEVLEVCPGGAPISLAVTVSDNAGDIGYVWTGDASIIGFLDDVNSPMPNLTVPAGFSGDLTYTLEATDDVCTETVPITIAISAPAPPTITGDMVLCDGEQGSLDGGDGYSTYEWSNGETTQTINVNSIGNYSLTVTSGGNCVSESSVNVTEGNTPAIMLSSSFAHCIGETVTVTATGDFAQLEWPDGSSNPSWTTGDVGDFMLIATSSSDCVENFEFSVAELPTPEFNITIPENLTCNNTGINLIVEVLSSNTNISYNWTGPDINAGNARVESPFVNLPGEYTLVITDEVTNCVSVVQAVMIDEMRDAPDASISQSVPFDCASTSVSLSIPSAPVGNTYTVNWMLNNQMISGDVSFEAMEAGNYTVSVTNDQTGCTNTASYALIYNDDAPESAVFNLIPQRCSSDNDASIEVVSVVGGQGPFMYSLNGATPTNSSLFANLAPGEYRVDIIDSRSCSITETVSLAPTANNLELNITSPIVIQLGDPLRLEALLLSSNQTITDISWTSDAGLGCSDCDLILNLDNVFDGDDFTISVRDTLGCVATATTRVIVEKKYNVFFPNTFSPNGDGTNDRFLAFGSNIVEQIQELSVFDRWGDMVYEQTGFSPNDSSLGWDGKIDGQAAAQGVYIYMAKVSFIDGHVAPFQGSLLLLR